jgi:hypothetical protein
MKLSAGLLAVTVVAALAPVGSALSTASASPTSASLSDPSVSVAPSFGFKSACDGTGTSQGAIDACESAAIPDFDAVRQTEGLPPLVLPNDFDTLSVPEQLLAITDIERVDRGLPPVPALSSAINALAQEGANARSDPPFPTPLTGDAANSNWDSVSSALLADFDWMYDDGVGSPNGDCPAAGQPGCWGHRHTILTNYDTPIAMGAAISGESITEELVGGDKTDKADGSPTWDQIAATTSFGLDPDGGSLAVPPGAHESLTITATSGGEAAQLTASIQSGAAQWSVSPSSCALAADGSCVFTVTFSPPSSGRFPGILAVNDGVFVKTAALAGVGTAPQVAISLGRSTVRQGQRLTVFGQVEDATTRGAVSGVQVTLEQRNNGGSPWQPLSTATTGPRGKVSYRVRPFAGTAYRLVVLSASGTVEAASGIERVRVSG